MGRGCYRDQQAEPAAQQQTFIDALQAGQRSLIFDGEKSWRKITHESNLTLPSSGVQVKE
jgi:hypothetical protein